MLGKYPTLQVRSHAAVGAPPGRGPPLRHQQREIGVGGVERLSTIELTRSEKDLLLNDLDLDSIVGDKIRLLAQRGNTIVVKLEREQVERMVNALEEAAAEGAGEAELAKAYRRISARSWSAPYRPEALSFCACPQPPTSSEDRHGLVIMHPLRTGNLS